LHFEGGIHDGAKEDDVRRAGVARMVRREDVFVFAGATVARWRS
jgi:hypothetical protein